MSDDPREKIVMQQGAEIHRLKVTLGDIVHGARTLQEAKDLAAKALGEPQAEAPSGG